MRYRKIDPRMWGDEKFRALSKPQPNAQTLWQYLLTGPHTNGCPGLYHIGELAISEALGWPLKGFRKAFQEIFQKGMAEADWEARVIYIPQAKKYDPPESPNVLKKWARDFDEIPECNLKAQFLQDFKAFMEGFREGFREAFREAFAKAFGEGSDGKKPSIPEPEPKPEPKPKNPLAAKPKPSESLFEKFWSAYPNKKSKGEAEKAWSKIKPDEQLLARMLATIERAKTSVRWIKESGEFIPYPATWLNAKGWEDHFDTERSTGPPMDPIERRLWEIEQIRKKEKDGHSQPS